LSGKCSPGGKTALVGGARGGRRFLTQSGMERGVHLGHGGNDAEGKKKQGRKTRIGSDFERREKSRSLRCRTKTTIGI